VGKYQVKRLSATAVDVYYQCLQKYFYKYFSKEKPLADTLALRFGNAVHASLEILCNKLLTGVILTEDLCEEVVHDFMYQASKRQIDNPALISEGVQFIRDRMHKHNPNHKIMGVEFNFGNHKVTTANGTPLNGKIDLILEESPIVGIVVDYKTSKKAKSPEEANTDIQLSMYDYVMSLLFPQYEKVWLVFDYLRIGTVISDRAGVDRKTFETQMDTVYETMGKLKDDDIVPNINVFCPWCDYRHLCKGYNDLLESEIGAKPIESIVNDVDFAAEWKKVKDAERIVRYRIKELKEWADIKAGTDGKVLFDNKVSWTPSNKTSLDPAFLLPYIPSADLVRLVTFKKDETEAYIDQERPDLKPLYDQAVMSIASGSRLYTKK
jgi:hypothetical protein